MLGVVRTTLDIDDDVLQAAKELAKMRGVSIGRMVSALIREALERRGSPRVPVVTVEWQARKPSLVLVNRLRDRE